MAASYVRYRPRGLIADGLTCVVVLGDDLVTGEPIVVKQPKPWCTQTFDEISILANLSHPGIVKLRGVAQGIHGDAPVYAYAAGGDLHGLLGDGGLPEREVKRIMFQLFEAVAYLHAHGVWHRDLKPENILVRANGSVVVADFGHAVRTRCATLEDAGCGTLEYSAPELILCMPYSEKVDMWSLGVTMFVCLTGFYPFECDDDPEEIKLQILYGAIRTLERPSHVSEMAMNLIRKLTADNWEQRPSAVAALNDPWFDDLHGKRHGNPEDPVFQAAWI
jgi:serine/threonine protein kinase